MLNYKKGDFSAEFKAYDRKISYKNSAKYYILEKKDKIESISQEIEDTEKSQIEPSELKNIINWNKNTQ